ncbi:UNVERIFIED_CONTAM: hypothetical protein Slati_1552800 [Sesamum latifolium]|uniref:Uncharacterized protein n=1 Tax=Sesamum latifolium TaxID=2727402 RepID=A0AAW2X7Z5_9LAMI
MKAEERRWLKEGRWAAGLGLENEGMGSSGRMEGSLDRQDCKVVVITLQILSLKRLAMAAVLACGGGGCCRCLNCVYICGK